MRMIAKYFALLALTTALTSCSRDSGNRQLLSQEIDRLTVKPGMSELAAEARLHSAGFTCDKAFNGHAYLTTKSECTRLRDYSFLGTCRQDVDLSHEKSARVESIDIAIKCWGL